MSPAEEKLHEALDAITASSSRDEFVEYMDAFVLSLKGDGCWERTGLESFLEGLKIVAADLHRYYTEPGEDTPKLSGPCWRFFAELLFAARCAQQRRAG